jgi:uncharacterized membrane protein YtjA (UPF0391 family)
LRAARKADFGSRERIWFLSRPEISAFAGQEPRFPRRIVSSTDGAGKAPCDTKSKQEVLDMLGWVVTFLIIALIAGVLGFGGIAGASIEIAKIIFFIAVVLFLVSAVIGVARGRTRV